MKELEDDILRLLTEFGPMRTNEIVTETEKRLTDVRNALMALCTEGRILNAWGKWEVASP